MFRKTVLDFDFLFLCLLMILCRSSSLHHHHHHHPHHHHHGHEVKKHAVFPPKKLFVFGDSYSDTGNTLKGSSSAAWKVPYGETFPGKPSGRFSDGRILTDFVANYFGLPSPIPYNFRKNGTESVEYGINFAIGGTGVFQTLVALPNMTVQIDMFKQLIDGGLYTKADLESSIALVTLAGNDYNAYLSRNGSFVGLPAFIGKVVTQLTKNIKRIHDLGIKKVAVTGLEPLGCLPQTTYTSDFQKCNDTVNALVIFHNQLLAKAVNTLNIVARDSSAFVILDLYDSFLLVIKSKGNSTFPNPLQPCCVGISTSHSCGNVDSSGAKLYKLCPDPRATFFWDLFHPTQQGWKAVYSHLASTLKQL